MPIFGQQVERDGRQPRKGVKVRKLLIATIAVGTILLPASTAWARGGGWQPLPIPPFDAACGATTVHVTIPVNKEFYRAATLPDGTIEWDITGALKATYSTDAGASVSANVSGPGTVLFFTNGDFQQLGRGLSAFAFTEDQAAALGVPQIPQSAGPVDLTFHTDGTVSGHLGNILQDICAELGLPG
jgi:hypothetical protein